MINEKEEQSLREYGNRKKRYKRRRRVVIVAFLLLFAIMGVAYLIYIYNRSYDNYGVRKTIDNTGKNAVGYLSYGTSVVKYSKDGATAVDKDGNTLWNGSYEMNDPIADTCGQYVVIADRDGKSVHIFNRKKEVGNFNTLYNISKVEVASQGVVAALMEEGEYYHIFLYDVDGTVLVTIDTSNSEAGYPLDISLSDDGKKLVTSYQSYSEGVLKDKVSFYNYGEVGQNYTDGFVGGWTMEDGIVAPRVEFVNNDTVCVYKDNGFDIYSIEEKPRIVVKNKLEGRIRSILYNDKYVGVVLQSEGTSPKRIMLYNLKGKKVLDKAIDFEYNTIYLAKEEIIMYDSVTCQIMKLSGRKKFKYTFDSSIGAFYPINGLDRYYLANDNKLSQIQLEE